MDQVLQKFQNNGLCPWLVFAEPETKTPSYTSDSKSCITNWSMIQPKQSPSRTGCDLVMSMRTNSGLDTSDTSTGLSLISPPILNHSTNLMGRFHRNGETRRKLPSKICGMCLCQPQSLLYPLFF